MALQVGPGLRWVPRVHQMAAARRDELHPIAATRRAYRSSLAGRECHKACCRSSTPTSAPTGPGHRPRRHCPLHQGASIRTHRTYGRGRRASTRLQPSPSPQAPGGHSARPTSEHFKLKPFPPICASYSTMVEYLPFFMFCITIVVYTAPWPTAFGESTR